jgi:hypothetical protein
MLRRFQRGNYVSGFRRLVCLVAAVLLATAHALSAQNVDPGPEGPQSLPNSCTVFGFAINARTREPVADAIVILSSTDYETMSAPVKTDDRGAFLIHGVAPGKYRIASVKQGFSLREFGAPRPLMAGDVFVVNGGEKKGPLNLEMTPSSRLSGRIVDLEKTPVAGLRIELMQFKAFRDEWHLVSIGTRDTAEDGGYSFDSISPGRYYIHASPKAFIHPRPRAADARCASGPKSYRALYYPGVDTPDSASALIVEEGIPTVVPDLVMEPHDSTCAVGRITFPHGNAEDVQVSVLEPDAVVLNAESITDTVTIRPSDDFEISGIAPGPYLIALLPQSSTAMYQMHSAAIAPAGTDTLTLPLAGTGRADLTVVTERSDDESNAVDLSRVVMQFRSRRVINAMFEAHIDASGHGMQDSLPGDLFTVHLDAVPENVYLKSVRVNGGLLRETTEAFSTNTDSPTSLLFTLSTDGGSLDGFVVGDGPGRQLNAAVILIATERGQDLPRILKLVTPDASGYFKIAGIPPGDYRILALGDLEWGSAYDPAVISRYQSNASRVSVAARSEQRITLHLVRADLASTR